ncbi:MAG TPA: CARDB domain-containing protein, partial [bacterium]|nr:CARDB domain-containing protein [bacterium]
PYFYDGSTFNMNGGIFRSKKGLVVSGNDTFQATGGLVEIVNDSWDTHLEVHDGNYFYDLKVDALTNDVDLFCNIEVMNNFDILSGIVITSNSTFIHNDFNIDGSFEMGNDAETVVHNNLNISGNLKMGNGSDILAVENNIYWLNGSTDMITDGFINLYGDWYYNDGTDAQLGTGNMVNFVGSGSQLIYNFDDNASFGNVTIDKPDITPVWLDNSSTHDFQIDGDLTLTNNSRLQVQSNTLTVDGTLDIENGSKMYLEHTGGELINNSDFTLNGELDVDGGDVSLNGYLKVWSDGVLTIDDGSFIIVQSNNQGGILGTYNQSAGLFQTDSVFRVYSSATINITGGIIRSNNFDAEYANTFQPSGGAVEIQTDNISYSSIECSNGNYFNKLSICPTSGGGAYLESDIIVQNDLEITSGQLWFKDFEATVNNDAIIYGGLLMEDSSDILNVANDITWFSGSSSSGVTNGNINVYGDWYFNDGTDAQLGTGNTVNFIGSENSTIYCNDDNACFGSFNINKDTSGDKVTIFDNDVCRAAGDFDISGGYILMGDLSSLEIGNALNINNGGKFDAGANDDACTITKYGTDPYAFNVNSGGTIDASSTVFEYMNSNGVNVKSGATVDATTLFMDCIFCNGETGGTLLTIDNDQDITIDNVEFYAGARDATYNITKNENQGHVTITNASGDLVGPAYENDMYDRIDWTGYAPDLTITNVVWSDTSSCICSVIDVDVTVKNIGDAASEGCVLDLYYNLDAPPSPTQSGQKYSAVPVIDPGDSLVLNFDQICTDTTGTWHSYFQIDTDQEVTESNEDNNIWGPDTINWEPLPLISDLTISYNTTTGEVELNWTYPDSADYYNIYQDTNPNFTPGPGNFVGSILGNSYAEIPPGDKCFYKVTAVKTCPAPVVSNNKNSSQRNNLMLK